MPLAAFTQWWMKMVKERHDSPRGLAHSPFETSRVPISRAKFRRPKQFDDRVLTSDSWSDAAAWRMAEKSRQTPLPP